MDVVKTEALAEIKLEEKCHGLKILLDLKELSNDRQRNMNVFYREKHGLIPCAGPHQRETTVKKGLGRLNKGPLLEATMDIWEELEKSRVFINKVVELCKKEVVTEATDLISSFEESFSKASPINDSKLDEHLDKIGDKLSLWSDTLLSDINSLVEEKVKETLPDIVDTTVKDISKSPKFSKPWSDLFKKTQNELKSEANNAFRTTLSATLVEHQHEVIESVQQKHEADMLERERRSRNIVIANVPECTNEVPTNRLHHDISFVKALVNVTDSQIKKCIRAGPKREGDSKPRPIVVTLESPELAKSLHKYGNGSKVLYEAESWWINPDLTQADRRAAFKARQFRRERFNKNLQRTVDA